MFIGRTDVEAEAPILGHLVQRADSLEKTMMLGKIEGERKRGQQRMSWLDVITNSTDMTQQIPGESGGRGSLACCSSYGGQESDTI